MYTRSRRGKACINPQAHGMDTQCAVKGRAKGEGGGEARALARPGTTRGAHRGLMVVGLGQVGSTHTHLRVCRTHNPQTTVPGHAVDTAANRQTSCGGWDLKQTLRDPLVHLGPEMSSYRPNALKEATASLQPWLQPSPRGPKAVGIPETPGHERVSVGGRKEKGLGGGGPALMTSPRSLSVSRGIYSQIRRANFLSWPKGTVGMDRQRRPPGDSPP